MPIYEYEHCGESFEETHSMEDRDNAVCPKCGEKAEKKFSTFIFEGDFVP